MLVRTTMMFVHIRSVVIQHLSAVVGRIRCTFSLLTVHVADVVGIFLVEVFPTTREHPFKIHQGIFQCQPSTLEEQTVLEPSPVLQMMVLLESNLKFGHTQRHILEMLGDVLCGQLHGTVTVVVTRIFILQCMDRRDVL